MSRDSWKMITVSLKNTFLHYSFCGEVNDDTWESQSCPGQLESPESLESFDSFIAVTELLFN